jgi:TPR repeat protein
VLLLEGREVPQDCAEAFRWLSMAAERGAPRAKYHLGVMYATGTAVERDVQRARTFLEEASDRGEVLACIELARLEISLGQIENALKWYVVALDQESRVHLPEQMEEARRFVADHPR